MTPSEGGEPAVWQTNKGGGAIGRKAGHLEDAEMLIEALVDLPPPPCDILLLGGGQKLPMACGGADAGLTSSPVLHSDIFLLGDCEICAQRTRLVKIDFFPTRRTRRGFFR